MTLILKDRVSRVRGPRFRGHAPFLSRGRRSVLWCRTGTHFRAPGHAVPPLVPSARRPRIHDQLEADIRERAQD